MKLYTTKETAQILGISYSLLTRLRRLGCGPRFIKLTMRGSIRYTEKAIENYIESRQWSGNHENINITNAQHNLDSKRDK